MEELEIIREIFMGFRSLIAVTLLIAIFYTLFYLRFNGNLSSENRQLLRTLAITISFICLLFITKTVIPILTHKVYPYHIKYLCAGNILQLYLPVQIYTLQRFYGYFSKIRDVITLTAGVFLLNITLIIVSFLNGVEQLTLLQYPILIIIIGIIIYQYFTLRIAFKEIFSSSNKYSYSLKGDIFILITSSTIALLLALSLYTNVISLINETLKVLLGIINLALLIKVLIFSSYEKPTRFQVENLRTPSSITSSDFFDSQKDDDLKKRLISYFESEKPYLNPKLTINEVALYLYSNKTYLSRLINDHYNNNFNQFVNFYRIKVAKDLYAKDNNLSINQLCDLSGFGSMATFTMAFRLYVGNSPAEWCKEQKIKSYNGKEEN